MPAKWKGGARTLGFEQAGSGPESERCFLQKQRDFGVGGGEKEPSTTTKRGGIKKKEKKIGREPVTYLEKRND